jgi:hypothetical protein
MNVHCSAGINYFVIYPSGVISRCWARQSTELGSVTELRLDTVKSTFCASPDCRPCDFWPCAIRGDNGTEYVGPMCKEDRVVFRLMPIIQCNYSCKYCVVLEEPTLLPITEANSKMIKGEAWARWWEFIAPRWPDFRLYISGGEPTLYPDFDTLMMAISKLPAKEPHILFTNLSRPEKMKVFLEGKAPNILIEATAHPSNKGFNFERFCQTVEEIRRAGLPNHVHIVGLREQEGCYRALVDRLGRVVKMANKQLTDNFLLTRKLQGIAA